MSDSHSFSSLMKRFNAGGSNKAADVIVPRFASRLAALAARKMSQRLQQKLEPEDTLQSVWATFFRRIDDGQLELRDWDSLWGLLAQITVWRICRHAEQLKAKRRSQERESPLIDDTQVLDREPGADDLVVADETRAQLVDAMPERYRPILQKILEGVSHEVIAKELGTSLSTVERVHRRARELLKKILKEGLST